MISNYTAKGCEPHEHKQNTGSTDMSENTNAGRVSIPLQRELERLLSPRKYIKNNSK